MAIDKRNPVDRQEFKEMSGVAGVLPAASASTPGVVKQAATVAAITPATDGTTAGTAVNAILTALKAAGIMA